MASTPDLRQGDHADVGEGPTGRALPFRSRVRLAALAALLAVTSLGLLALLAGSKGDAEVSPQVGFLTRALGVPHRDAPLVREPARGIRLETDERGVRVRREGAVVGLAADVAAETAWRRFERGAVRRTPFGSETVLFYGEDGLEQFLTVAHRQGPRTWRWRLETAAATPTLRDDGSVLFLAGTRTTGLQIAPVAILDARGRDVTPEGLAWSLGRRDDGWWLQLRLDDRGLPLPYTIDPAITRTAFNTANTTGATSLTIARPGNVGDLLVAQIAKRNTNPLTAPAGWTLLNARAQGTIHQAVYWKVATGSESTTWSWTGNVHATGGITAYANPHPTAPIDVATSNAGTGGTATATGGTAGYPEEMVTALYAIAGNETMTQSAGQGVAQVYTDGTAGGGPPGSRITMLAADGVQASSGAVAAKTATFNSADWVAHLVAIRRAPDDGDGTITAGTSAVSASSTGNTITFTYTAGAQGTADGAVTLAVPSGWSAPSTTGSSAGYATASTGTLSVAGQTITVSGLTLAPNATMTVTYGSKASGGPGASASSAGGAVTWQVQQRGTAAGTLTDVTSSPSITQYAADGSGTMSVSPTTVDVGTNVSLTFTYTAAAGGTSGGSVRLTVPAGWTAPTTTAGTAGYTTASTGTVSVSGQEVTVAGVTLAGGATLTVVYGSGAGGAVTVPSGTGPQTWSTAQRSTAAGTLTALAASPATTTNAAPSATVTLGPSAPKTSDTVTATATKSDADGDAVTLDFVWKVDGVTVKTTSDSASPTDTLDLSAAGNGDKGQTVSVEVTPNDGRVDGSTASDAETVANSAPAVSAVAIDQAAPKTDDTLTVTVTASDPDGDALTTAHQWRKNGADLAGATSSTLDLSAAGNGDRGDALAVRVTVADGTDTSAPSTTAAVTVANSLPSTSASLSPASPATDDTLTATATKGDADGDAVTLTYVWKVGGTTVKTTAVTGAVTDTLDLSLAGNGDRGETVTVEVTPYDGTADGLTAADSEAVANSAPSATVSLGPAAPATDDVVTATAATGDADGDTVTLTYVWKVDGSTVKTTAATASTSDTLDLSLAGNGDRGQTVSVEVTPSDGAASGAAATDSEVVANAAPSVTSVAIDQAAPKTNDTLTVTVAGGDADGDPLTWSYQWAKDGVDLAGETGAALDLSALGNGDRGDGVTVRVTASDGSATSAPSTSAGVTVANSAPTASVALAPDPPAPDDVVTATVTPADADGDAVTLTYVWKVNGGTVRTTAGTSSTTDAYDLAGGVVAGDAVSVEVTPSDGTASGAAATASAAVGNSLPTATVSLAPSSPATGDTLTATATKGDGDGDAVTLTFVWKVDGSTVKTTAGTAALTDTLDLSLAGNGDEGETVTVEVTPNDGTADGATVSDAEVVANTAPTATVSLAPAAPKTDELVTATATTGDVDGDAVTLTYVWKVDGTTVKTTAGTASSTDTLDLSLAGNGDRGQTVSVEVTPNDGDADGSAASDSEVVANSAPSVSSAAVDQAAPTTNDTLTVTVVASDPDGDALTTTHQWRKDGVDLAGETGATLDLSAAGNGDRGDAISVRVTVSDGIASSAASTSPAVTVANAAPTVASVAIDQAGPRTNDALTVTVAASDPDGDVVTLSHQWAVDGVDRFGETAAGYDLSLVGNGDRGDAITVRVTAGDGTDTSSAVTSGAVIVANSAPAVDAVAIDQAAPRTNDAVTVTVVASDADGDAVAYAYQWSRNGADIAGATAATLDLSTAGNGDKGDAVAVRVTASDGSATSAPSTSGAVAVANSAPVLSSLAVDQGAPRTDDAVTATVAASDADGDALTTAYQWTRNGADLAGETAATLDLSAAGNGDKGDAVAVRVSVSDGAASAGPLTSAGVTVANTPPSCAATAIETTQNAAAETAPLCTDADTGDTLAPAIAGQGSKGVASVVAGALRYTPNADEKGADAFTYRASDGTDESAAAGVTVTIDDVTPPATTIDGGPAAGSASSSDAATFAFSADEAGSSFECRVDGGAWAACASPHALSALAEGAHTFEVRATDDHANTDPTPASRTWTVDTVAPETALDAGPGDPSDDATPTFAFSSEPGATFECRLDGGAWASCTSPHAAPSLADGAHTFDVRAADAAGNVDATPAAHAWTVDTGAPTVALDDPGASLSGTVTLTAAAGDAGGSGVASVRFERSPADAGSWTTIGTDSDPAGGWSVDWSTGGIGDGLYDLRAVATDAAGNAAASALVEDRQVDNGAPTVSFAAPSGYVSAAAADPFAVTASVPDADVVSVEFFECSEAGCVGGTETSIGTDADGPPWTVARAIPADGRWTLKAVATDGAANTGAAVVDATVDRTAPSGGSVSYVDGWDTDGTVAVTTSDGSDGGSGLAPASRALERDAAPLAAGSCGAFGEAWTAVSAPDTTAAGGSCYRYRLRISDRAGNEATYTSAGVAKVDTTAPAAPTLAFSALTNASASGSTLWFRPGAAGGFTLTSSSADAQSGIASHGFPDLGTGWSRTGGAYGFTASAADPVEPNAVTATNGAGLVSPAASFTVSADGGAPTTTDDAPAGWSAGDVTVTLAAGDGSGSGVALTQYRLDGGAWQGGTTVVVAAPGDHSNDGEHTLEYRSTDAVGNVEAIRSATVRIDTTAPSAPGLSFGSFTNASATGTTVFFRPGAAGGFTVTASAGDGGSGVASYAFPALGSGWTGGGGAYTFDGSAADPAEPNDVTAADAAGNVSAPAGFTVSGDSAAPATGDDAPAGWQAGPVTVTLTPDDGSGSGIAATTYELDGGATQTGTTVAVPGTDGTHTIVYRSRDRVGNVEGDRTATVAVDGTGPTASLSFPADGGVYRAASWEDVAGAAADSTSGVGLVEVALRRLSDGFWWDAATSSWTSSVSPLYAAAAGTGGWTYGFPVAGFAADGLYEAHVRATDAVGNSGAAVVHDFRVDRAAPATTDDAPAGWSAADVTVTLTAGDGSGSGVAATEYRVDGGAWRSGAVVVVPAPADHSNDGAHTVEYRSTDAAGNVEATRSAVVRIDTTAPTTTDDAPAGYANGPVTVTLAPADAGGAGVATTTYEVDGGATRTGTSVSIPGVEGVYAITYRSTDAAGNVEADRTAAVRVDTTAPTTTDDAPSGWQGGAVTVTLTGGDAGGAGVATTTYEVDAGATQAGTSVAVPAATGTYAITYRSTDAAGNVEADRAATVRVDVTPPSVSVTYPAGGALVSGVVTLTSTSSDAHAGVATVAYEYSAAGAGDWRPTTSAWDTAELDDGAYDLRAIATDGAGNATASALVAGVQVDNDPPTLAFDAPADGTFLDASAGDPFTLRATASDAGTGVQQVEFFQCTDTSAACATGTWSSVDADATGSPYTASWTLPADGRRALRAVATDDVGHATARTIEVTVDRTAPSAPLADPGAFVRGTVTLASGATDATSGVTSVVFQLSSDGGATWPAAGEIGSDTTAPYSTAWDTTARADGPVHLRAFVTDAAGNSAATAAPVPVTVDNTAPTTADDAPAGWRRLPVTVTLSAGDGSGSGVAATHYRVDGGEWQSGATVLVAAPADHSNDGTHAIEYRSTDAVGNVEAVSGATVRIDTTTPTTSDDAPGGWSASDVTVTLTADDGSGSGVAATEYRVDGGAWQTGTSVAIPAPADHSNDGVHTVEYRSTDVAGNVEETRSATVRIDTTAPATSDDAPAGWQSGPVTVTLAPGDGGGSGVAQTEYRLDGGAWQTGTTVAIPTATGVHQLEYRSTDAVGNAEPVRTVTVQVDSTAPSTGDDAPGGPASTAVTVVLSPTDPHSGVASTEWRLDGGPWQSGTSVFVAAPGDHSNDGTHTIEYRSTDAVGNVEATRTTTVEIDTVGASGGPVDPGSFLRGTVALEAAPADDSGVVSVEFWFAPAGTGAWAQVGSTLLAAPWQVLWSTTAVADGDYDVKVVVTDGAGNVSEELLPGVPKTVDNTSPTGAVTAPAAGALVGGAVTLSASASDTPTAGAVASVEFFVRPTGASGFASVGTDTDAPYGVSWSSDGAADGPAEVYAVVRDVAGNAPTTTATRTFTVDNDAPAVALSAPAAAAASVALAATGSADIASVSFEQRPAGGTAWTGIAVDSTPGDGFAATWTTAALDGDFELRAVATDGSGNTGASATQPLLVDNTAPTGSVTQPGADATVGGPSILLQASTSDGGSGVAAVTFEYRAVGDPGAYTPIPGSTWDATGVPTGSYTVRAVVTDAVGNGFTTPAVTVTVDSTAPTVQLLDPGASLQGTVTLTANVSGAGATRVVFSVAPAGGGPWTDVAVDTAAPWTAALDTRTLADGDYDVRARVVDGFGNANDDVVASRLVDNTRPTVVSSAPADGSVVASASGIDVTASETLGGVDAATLDGAPVAIAPAGASFTLATGALGEGPHTLAGTLRDVAGRTRRFRVHFTVSAAPATSAAYVERNTTRAAATTLAAVDGSATVTMPAGAWAESGDDWLVLRVDALPAGSIAGSASLATSAAVDVTARWAISGAVQHAFSAPVEVLLPTGGVAGLVPATHDGSTWRTIPLVPGRDLPAGWSDGYFADGAGVHVLTRHLSVFGLLHDTEPPGLPHSVAGVVADDGLTLRWLPPGDNSGIVHRIVLQVNGVDYATFEPTQYEVKMGAFDATDTRRFTFKAVDLAGNESASTAPLLALPPLGGLTLAEASAALAERGFSVGAVREQASAAPAGTVIEPAAVRLAVAGSAVDLAVASPHAAPAESRLVLGVVGARQFSWKRGKAHAVRIAATRASRVRVSLMSPRGVRVYTWRFDVRAGATIKRLRMPRQVRRAGRYRLVVVAAAGTQSARRTIPVEVVSSVRLRVGREPRRRLVEVVLAGDSRIRDAVALGLETSAARVVRADADSAFVETARPARGVQVVVVDVDRHGMRLVRDLRTVFPEARLLALSARRARLAQALSAGADVVLPRSAPPGRIARAIRGLAARG